MFYRHHPSPMGTLLLAADSSGLRLLQMDTQYTSIVPEQWVRDTTELDRACRQLDEYFAGRRQHFSLQLAAQGSAFQRTVWQGLLTIPYGETRSYSQLATQIGHPTAARALGAANGANPLAIIVPCHRVIGANGALTGFSAGLQKKIALLRLEGHTFSEQQRLEV